MRQRKCAARAELTARRPERRRLGFRRFPGGSGGDAPVARRGWARPAAISV